jgi:OmpA-OmpF porin, OOP family
MDTKRKLFYALTAGTLLGVTGGASAVQGYLTDNLGEVVRNSAGDCVTTNFWTPEDAIAECHPQFVQAREPEVAAFEERRQITQLITLEADTTFDFDQATLTDEAKAKLDEIARRATESQDPRVRVVGYADWIGPESYNRDLSRRRAQSVEDYLASRGVPAQAIEIAGRGESNPVVSCEGLKGNALVSCLRPNRRTEIEFSAFEVLEEQPEGGSPQR